MICQAYGPGGVPAESGQAAGSTSSPSALSRGPSGAYACSISLTDSSWIGSACVLRGVFAKDAVPRLRSWPTKVASTSQVTEGGWPSRSQTSTRTRPWTTTGSPRRIDSATLRPSERQQFTVYQDVLPSTQVSPLRHLGVQPSRNDAHFVSPTS